jgi:hypothetical protein
MPDKELPDTRWIERPFDPARKRYYMVSSDSNRSTGGFKIVNLDAFQAPDGYPAPLLYRSTPSEVKVFAGRDEDGYDCYYNGPRHLPKNLPAKPTLKVGLRGKPLDVYGHHGHPFVSNRAKQLLESIDPNAFEFLECEAFTRNKVNLEPYWYVHVVGLVIRFDEERSVFREVSSKTGLIPSGQAAVITNLYEAQMIPEEVGNKHAFYLLKYTTHYIFDEVIVDAWRQVKFTGFNFSPLQTPTKREKTLTGYVNWDYFIEFGRKYWRDLV